MKRYIRTKDGEILDTKCEPKVFKYNYHAKFIIDDNNLIVYDTVFKDRIANHGEILKQSDNLKDLCDEFVFHTLDGYEQHFLSQGHLEDVLSNKNIDLQDYLSCREIYGAIWTDKGLTYVAKMNSKGDLELL